MNGASRKSQVQVEDNQTSTVHQRGSLDFSCSHEYPLLNNTIGLAIIIYFFLYFFTALQILGMNALHFVHEAVTHTMVAG